MMQLVLCGGPATRGNDSVEDIKIKRDFKNLGEKNTQGIEGAFCRREKI